jgi:signal peptidase I
MIERANSPNGDEESRTTDESATRKKSLVRSWICPGAGFALIGKRPYAMAAFVASLCFLPSVAWLSFRPTAASLWTAISVFVIAAVLWLAEQIAIKKAALQPPGPAALVRGFVASSCIMWLTVAAALGLFLTSFGKLRMAGTGTKPTLECAEPLVYHKYVDWESVKPGAVIVYRNGNDSAWGEPGWIVISRILAGPGNDISIQGGKYMVDGISGPPVAGTGAFDVVLDIPTSPGSMKVPAGCYFIVQDSPEGGFDSRVLSWVRDESIIGSRLWRVGRPNIFQPVE